MRRRRYSADVVATTLRAEDDAAVPALAPAFDIGARDVEPVLEGAVDDAASIDAHADGIDELLDESRGH